MSTDYAHKALYYRYLSDISPIVGNSCSDVAQNRATTGELLRGPSDGHDGIGERRMGLPDDPPCPDVLQGLYAGLGFLREADIDNCLVLLNYRGQIASFTLGRVMSGQQLNLAIDLVIAPAL